MLDVLLIAAMLSGSGVIVEKEVEKPYYVAAQMKHGENRLRISLDDEELDLIFTNNQIYSNQVQNQNKENITTLFAKMVTLGVLDPFLILEILSGERKELYLPYMTTSATNPNQIELNISSTDFINLYEHWLPQVQEGTASKKILHQVLTGLSPTIKYTFHTDPKTGHLTYIDMVSETCTPHTRRSYATFKVTSTIQEQCPGQLPSS